MSPRLRHFDVSHAQRSPWRIKRSFRLSDKNGNLGQTLNYLPFGEEWVNSKNTSFDESRNSLGSSRGIHKYF